MGIPLEFSALGHCADWLRRGNYISPAPPFLTLCRAFETRGLRHSFRGGPPGGPYLSACGGQLLTARLRRAMAEGLRCAAFDCVAFAPCCSFLLKRAVLSHPLRGAYRAFSPGRTVALENCKMVESKGLEPSTSCLQSRCSSH